MIVTKDFSEATKSTMMMGLVSQEISTALTKRAF